VECQETSDAKVQEKRTMGTNEHQKNKQQKVSIEKMDWMPAKWRGQDALTLRSKHKFLHD
jgi:hypothetical protein